MRSLRLKLLKKSKATFSEILLHVFASCSLQDGSYSSTKDQWITGQMPARVDHRRYAKHTEVGVESELQELQPPQSMLAALASLFSSF